MKKIDLYEVAIKILGLYLVVVIIEHLRDFLILLSVVKQQEENTLRIGDINQSAAIITLGVGLLVLTIFAFLLIFETKMIAKVISKPSDRNEEVRLFAKGGIILQLSLIIVGLISILIALPELIIQLRNYFTVQQEGIFTTNSNLTYILASGLRVVLGLIALAFSSQISEYLFKSNEKTDDGIDQEI